MKTTEHGVAVQQEFSQQQGKGLKDKVTDGLLKGSRAVNNKLIKLEVIVALGALGVAGGAAVIGAEAAAATGIGVAKTAGIAAGIDKGADVVVFEPAAKKRGLIDSKTHSFRKDSGVVFQLRQTAEAVRNQIAPQRMQTAAA